MDRLKSLSLKRSHEAVENYVFNLLRELKSIQICLTDKSEQKLIQNMVSQIQALKVELKLIVLNIEHSQSGLISENEARTILRTCRSHSQSIFKSRLNPFTEEALQVSCKISGKPEIKAQLQKIGFSRILELLRLVERMENCLIDLISWSDIPSLDLLQEFD